MAEVAEQITVQCACGKKLRAPKNAVGRKARCAKCGNVFTITAPPPPVPKQDDDGLGALYELAAEEKHAARNNQVEDIPRCPQCITPLPSGSVICTNCGFNVKSGKKLETKVAGAPGAGPATEKKGLFGFGGGKSKPSTGKKVEDAMAPQGSFMVGLGASAAGATVGGIIWFIIAMSTGYELGFIALLVGILAGLGMQLGQKGYSTMGGAAAAGISFLAIVLAKIAVIVAIIMPAIDEEEGTEFDDRIVTLVAEDHLRSKGLDPEKTSFEQDEEAYDLAQEKLEKMTPAQIKALEARADEQELKDELETYMAYEILQNMKIDPDNANETQEMMARRQAQQKINAMNAQQRQAELARLEKKMEAEIAAANAESGDEDEEEGGSAAGAAGFVLLLLLIVGWKSILFIIIAMSIAYKTAAGAVSD